jgi:hypothetical protein
MTQTTRQSIKREIEILEPGNGVQFISGDEVYREKLGTVLQYEYYSRDLNADDMPHIVFDIDLLTEWIFQNMMNDNLTECECDNTHQAINTVCRYCYAMGRRKWNDPEPLL